MAATASEAKAVAIVGKLKLIINEKPHCFARGLPTKVGTQNAQKMHKFASFNQKILNPEQINLSAISSATLFGRGIFTTVAIFDGEPFLWEKHWRRLQENAQKIGIDLSKSSESSVKPSLFELINANKIENARARITFFDESPNAIWNFETNKQISLLITTADFKKTNENLSLTVSPYRINSKSPLVNVKSCNYLENILALEDAKRKGFDEAVRLNEKSEIVSAIMANLFWIKDEKIYTSALETGCLAGTMREFLMENFEVEEKKIDLENLLEADEIFLTSAGIGIKSVAKIDEKKYGVPPLGGFSLIFKDFDFRRFAA